MLSFIHRRKYSTVSLLCNYLSLTFEVLNFSRVYYPFAVFYKKDISRDSMKIGKNLTSDEKKWILYDVANSAYALIVMASIMPLFYKSYFAEGLSDSESTAWWGFANSGASLVTAVMAPFLGSVADLRGYKKRLFAIFAITGIIATVSLVLPCKGCWGAALCIYIISLIGFSGANIFYDSMLVDISENEKMDWVSSNGYAWGYIGSVIPFLISIALIIYGQKSGTEIFMTRMAFVIAGGWWFILTIPLMKGFKQKYCVESNTSTLFSSVKRTFQTFSNIRKHKNAFIFIVSYFLYIDGVDTIIKMAVPYGKDIGLGSTQLILIVLMLQIIAFPAALAYGVLCKRLSAKTMILTGIAAYTLITFIGFLIPYAGDIGTKTFLFWALAVMVGLFQGGIQAISRSLFGKIIPKQQSAEFFGFFNISGKFATIAGPFLMAVVTRMSGDSRFGILAIMPLFIAGAAMLILVNETKSDESLD